MVHSLGIAIFLGYLAASLLLLMALYRPEGKLVQYGTIAHYSAFGGVIILTLVLCLERPVPLSLGVGDYYLALVLLCSVLARFFSLVAPVPQLLLASGTLLLFTGSSVLFHDAFTASFTGFEGLMLAFHVVPALVGQATLLLAAVAAGTYLFARRRLKRRDVNAVTLTGPGLGQLQNTHQSLCLTGLTAMTLAVLSGTVRGAAIDITDSTQALALLSWVLLAYLVHMQRREEGTMKHRAQVTVAGVFLLVVLGYCAIIATPASLHTSRTVASSSCSGGFI